jgi:hypothetical protein
LAEQDPDGGFTSIPDQVGPRPLPFDYPILTDIQTLTALRRTGMHARPPAAALPGRSRRFTPSPVPSSPR